MVVAAAVATMTTTTLAGLAKNYISYISFCHLLLTLGIFPNFSFLFHLYNTLFSSMLGPHLHLATITAVSILFPGKPTISDSSCTMVFPTAVHGSMKTSHQPRTLYI
jgi:hypothetical protein